ncbi:hypothetical protein FKZ61_013180 [Litorilinea aerophila]|uniref:DUF3604 domain-containing protein n=1 Tax=Litorilinea aerophila TaxID=1204385 RepID=A0A540VF10_9CHLR|nr:hypothetical protein [Litorilinea aerophila]MCC9077057.1 hypothetical protein [Litorilinea aerophila]
MKVRYEGATEFVATDKEPKPIKVIVECPEGLTAGTDVRVSISTFHSYTRVWTLDGIEVENGNGRFVLGHGLPHTWHQMTRGGVGPAGGGLIGRPVGEVYLCTIQITQSLSPGAHLVFAFRAAASPHADVEGSLLVKVRAPGVESFEPVGEPMPLHNAPGDPVRLEVRWAAAPDAHGKHRAVVFATDELLNPVLGYRGTITLKADEAVEGLPKEIKMGTDGRGVIDGIQVTNQGPVRVEVRDAARDLEARSAPIRLPVPDDLKHYFGAIHFHTRLSVDGDRDPRRAYAYVRDYLNLDVVAMTDHAPVGFLWEECIAVNEEFYEPGYFVTIPAWESSTAYGHANLYLRSPHLDAGPWYWDPDICPSEITWPQDVVMVPHHTNAGQIFAPGEHREMMDKGIYWAKYNWAIPNKRARLVEIVQGRGNFEADALDEQWGIRMGGQGASVQDALAQGWRLGFVAGSDNHAGYPTQRDGQYVGITCFRADALTREAIWQAMDRRRTYATSGVPIVCDFWVNGVASGGEAILVDREGVNFTARLYGTAPIEIVQIISNGHCVWQDQPNRWDIEYDELELPVPAGEWAYYYLRLRQADGHRAWLSPVWLDREYN